MKFYCTLCEEPHDSPADCPEINEDADDDEDLDTEEIRADLSETIAESHAALAVFITFPREDNDVEEMQAESGRFIAMDDLSLTEMVAAKAKLEDRIEELHEELIEDGPSGDIAGATAVPASALFGGNDAELPDTDGGGMFR